MKRKASELCLNDALNLRSSSDANYRHAHVVRREGNVLTRVCPSIHPSVCPYLGGIPHPGPGRGRGTPARSSLGGPHLGYPPWSDLAGGTPPQVPPSDLAGVPLPGGTPHQVTPPSNLAGGYPCWGVPHLGYPLIGPGQEVPPAGGYPTDGVLDMPRSVCRLRSRRRTFLFEFCFQIFGGLTSFCGAY